MSEHLESHKVVSLFRRSYVLALSLVASLLIGLVLISQWRLATQREDAALINLAGRQRMLSQRLAKELLLSQTADRANQQFIADLVNQWNDAHQSLKMRAFSDGASALVIQIDPLLQTISEQSKAYLRSGDPATLDEILKHEGQFLELMEALVRTYELEASARVRTEISLQWFMLLLLLGVLAMEATFIFRPLTKNLQQAFENAHAVREQAEEALLESQQSDRLKGEFLANVSHEIRTPMNGIIGLSELLMEREHDPESRDCARIIHHSAQCLLSILNDLLDMSKIQAGEFQLKDDTFDLRVVVEEAVKLQEVVASEMGLIVLLDIRSDVPRKVRGDQYRLRQVLLNLLTNAVKFTERGHVKMSVSLAEAGIRFAVSDTGPGIPKHKLKEIFQPFRQLDGSHSRSRAGTGLGLSIASSLVGLMKGSLEVESTPGSGSTFWFVLDLKPDSAEATESFSELRGKRILVQYSLSQHHPLLKNWVQKWGASLVECPTGEEALKVAAEDTFDFVFLDYRMESVDGLEIPLGLRKGTTRLVAFLPTSLDNASAFRQAGLHGVACTPLRRRVLELLLSSLLDQSVEFASPDSLVQVNTALPAPDERVVKVLIVDDNRLNCDVAARFLQRLGIQSEQVLSGQEALDLCSGTSFDLVLMDVQMPEMDGFETTQRLLESGYSNPIVALTANPAKRVRERCLEVGMKDLLSKPLSKESILRVISEQVKARTEKQ